MTTKYSEDLAAYRATVEGVIRGLEDSLRSTLTPFEAYRLEILIGDLEGAARLARRVDL